MKRNTTASIVLALLAAIFYAINTPLSKILLADVAPTFMAGFLYLGAGIGVGIMYIFHWKKEDRSERLTKSDLPYTVGMIVLDIIAPIFLMLGIQYGTASNASLLGNFEIVATTVIAFFLFREAVSRRLWSAIGLITLSSLILSFENIESMKLSIGSVFVILATLSWGFENNCTRKISEKSTYEIVFLKGIFSGCGSLLIAFMTGERMPSFYYICVTILLGFVSYGLSIFLYIRAQRTLGAAKTSAYYAVAPFIGSLMSFVFVGEKLTWIYLIAFMIMVSGTVLVVKDTLIKHHAHMHAHRFTHTHDGSTHEHIVYHSHEHEHYSFKDGQPHHHHHSQSELEALLQMHH